MKKMLPRFLVALITYLLMQAILYTKIRLVFAIPEQICPSYIAIRTLAAVFGVTLLTLLYTAIDLIIHKDQNFLSYIPYFVFYLGIMGVFFLLTYPGIFKGDEFYVLRSALSFQLSPAQSGLTSLFYICCLLFVPSMAAITGIQLLGICTAFSYIMKHLRELYPTRLVWIVSIPCLLLPVIDGNLFTLRSTPVGWLFTLMLFRIFFLYKKHSAPKTGLSDAVFFAVTGGLLCAWRNEYVYLLVLLPLALLFLRLCDLKKALLLMLALLLCFRLWNIPNRIAQDGCNKYPISLVLNPIANIFNQEHIDGPTAYEDILTINELVDVRLLRESASVCNISQYWNIPDILPQKQLSRFMAASLRIILYNFDDFLKYRFQTFAYTNGFYKDRINHPGGEMVSGILDLVYYGEDYKTKFILVNPILSRQLRHKTIEFLACRHYVQGEITTNILLPILYDCVPVIRLLTVCMLAALFRKKYWFCCLALLCMTQLILIFLTAPAMFFMYYFCFYLSGYLLCALFVLDTRSQRREQP
ncbi:MAG: hypothetical protein J6P60_05285 [Lachnospiraceae bacterium]|nr:hypothetical protein [Lachnospiraceae bacterium]